MTEHDAYAKSAWLMVQLFRNVGYETAVAKSIKAKWKEQTYKDYFNECALDECALEECNSEKLKHEILKAGQHSLQRKQWWLKEGRSKTINKFCEVFLSLTYPLTKNPRFFLYKMTSGNHYNGYINREIKGIENDIKKIMGNTDAQQTQFFRATDDELISLGNSFGPNIVIPINNCACYAA